MMDYDKIYERIVRRGDEILEQRRKKAAMIKQTSYAISGICATAIVGVGIWRISSSHKLNNNGFSDNNIVGNMETTSIASTTKEQTNIITTKTRTSVSSTASVQKTTTKNTTVTSVNTNASSNETSDHAINTTASNKPHNNTTQSTHSITSNITTSVDIKPVTTSLFVETTTTTFNEGPVTTSYIAPTSTSLSVNPVTTSITSSTVTTSRVTTTSINVQENFRSYPCVFGFNNGRYEKESLISQSNIIGDYIKKVSVNITLPNNWLIIENMEAYEIQNISIEEAVAVKLKDTEEYYLFKNVYYKSEESN